MPNCFIIMPMTTRPEFIDLYNGDDQHFDHVLELIFEPAVEKAGFTPIAPAAHGSDVIHASIIQQLSVADLVLCDMSALNPNVFFELGIRTALDKPVCVVKDDATSNVPFDTALINYHTYRSSLAGWEIADQIEKLSAHIAKSSERLEDGNSLWKYFGVHARAHIETARATPEDKIDYVVRRLDVLGRKIDERDAILNSLREDGRLGDISSKSLLDELVHIANQHQMSTTEISDRSGVDRQRVLRYLAGRIELSGTEIVRVSEAINSIAATRGDRPGA